MSQYAFAGQQTIAPVSPAAADLTTAATAMGTDIAGQMIAAFPVQQVLEVSC